MHSSTAHSIIIDSQTSPLSTVSSPTTNASLISTPAELTRCLDELSTATALYIDLEGHSLSRIGSLDIISISSHPDGRLYLIDVYALQHAAFSTPSASSPATTLKSMLEDTSLPKYFWDVRNDADALFSLYAIDLAGVTDLQLLELAARPPHPKKGNLKLYVRALASCIQSDLTLTPDQIASWAGAKDSVKALMKPRVDEVQLAGNVLTGKVPQILMRGAQASERPANESPRVDAPTSELAEDGEDNKPAQSTQHQITIPPGGPDLSESVFRVRPLTPEIVAYCANDVAHLPALHAEYMSRLSASSPWHDRVSVESLKRIAEARAPDYSSFAPDKAVNPWRKKVRQPATTSGGDSATTLSTVAAPATVRVMKPVRSGSRTVLKFKPAK